MDISNKSGNSVVSLLNRNFLMMAVKGQ